MKNVLVDFYAPDDKIKQLEVIPDINVTYVDPEEKVRVLPDGIIRDTNILFTTFPPENNAVMQQVELIQIASAGYTQLFGQNYVERNVRACNAAGVFDVPIGEWCISMMINLARDLRGMIRDQESGAFDNKKQYQHEVCGSTIGFWGYGGSARETARLAKTMGMNVHALECNGVGKRENAYVVPGKGDPEGLLPDRVFGLDETETFLSGLDFLIIAMPLTKLTEGIVGETELKALPDHAYVLNPARGPIIQEKAMLRALQEGWIAGAALDTHWYYPLPEDHPIRSFKNVIITPHISGSSKSPHFIDRIWDIFLTNLDCFLHGNVLMNELTSKQLDGV